MVDGGAAQPSRVLFAIGTANYDEPSFNVSEARRMAVAESVPQSLSTLVHALRSLRFEVNGSAKGYLLDLQAKRFRQAIRQASAAGDIVIIYYTGHGVSFDGDGYYLCTKDFRQSDRPDTGVRAEELPQLVAKRDAEKNIVRRQQPPTLIILDCCFSGQGGFEVLRRAVLTPSHRNLWVWATASRTQNAVSGAFADALSRLLLDPPVGVSTSYLPSEEIGKALKSALDPYGQTVEVYAPPGYTSVPPFFPNKKWVEGVVGLTVAEQHWISKVRAGSDSAGGGAGFYLTGCTGRVQAAADLARWITDSAAGHLAFVTGSPGTGKSALLALPILLSRSATRDTVLQGSPEGSLVHRTAEWLPLGTAMVAVHARGLNTDQVAQQIGAGLDLAAPTATGLLELLEDAPGNGTVVIVDAVDEARSPTTLRDSLLLPLARRHGLRLLVGARRNVLPGHDSADLTIDLDAPKYRDPEALVDYVMQLLVADPGSGVHTPYSDSTGRTDPNVGTVAAAIADRATSNSGPAGAPIESFLVARAIALAVRARPEPVDTTARAWTRDLPDGLAEAFEEDLDRLGERAATARVLLEALAWARGPGLPWETIWVPCAQAIAGLHPEPKVNQVFVDDDVRWLLERVGAYVVEDLGPGGRSVFRPFHNLLADHLRAQSADTDDETANNESVEAVLTAALLDTLGPAGKRRWDWTHPYLRTYLGEHALATGRREFSALLGESGFLAVADPSTLTPVLSHAPAERNHIVRSYRRARPLLGEDPAANAAYLQEAALATTGTAISFAGTGISPTYHTKWTYVRPDQSLLTFTGHTDQVSSVAFGSGAGGRALLASASWDGTVRVWDADTGGPVGQPVTGHTGAVESVAFGSGAGGRALLASGGDDGTVRVWDADTGEPVGRPLTGRTGAVLSVAFGSGAGGRALLASGGRDGTVRVWDADTGEPVARPLIGHTGAVGSVAFVSRAGRRALLASAVADGTVRVWDADTGEPVGRPLIGHTGAVLSVAFGSGAGGRALLASGGDDDTVRVWDPETGEPVGQPLIGHTGAVGSVAFGSGTGGRALLASGGGDGTVRVWDPDTGEPVGQPLIGHTLAVGSVAFGSGAGGRALLASSGADGTVRVWDPDTDEPVARPLTGHTGAVLSVAFGSGAGGRALLASAGDDDTVRLWDPDTGEPVGRPLTGHTGAVGSVAFGSGAGGRALLASASADGTVRLWDPDTGEPVGQPLTGHTGALGSVAFGSGAGGRALLASGADGTVRLWDPDTGEPVGQPLTGHTLAVEAVAFGSGASGRALLASASADGTVRVWDPDTGEPVGQPLTGHTGGAVSVAFGSGAGGRALLASASADGTVRLWDPDTGEPVGQPLTGHTGSVMVAFGSGAGGRALLASADDDTVRVWDPDTGEPLMTIRRRVGADAVASDGSNLAIGDREGLSVIDIS